MGKSMSNETSEILHSMKRDLEYDPKKGVIKYLTKRGTKNPGDTCGNIDRHGYIRIHYKDKWFQGHRVAWALYHGDWPKGNIDHINRDKSDNRLENLRDAPQWVNNHNKGKYPSKLGLRGVTRNKHLYQARICYKGKSKSLGYYKCPTSAALAYDREARKLFSEFATLNYP